MLYTYVFMCLYGGKSMNMFAVRSLLPVGTLSRLNKVNQLQNMLSKSSKNDSRYSSFNQMTKKSTQQKPGFCLPVDFFKLLP